jgi:hypothetical protein
MVSKLELAEIFVVNTNVRTSTRPLVHTPVADAAARGEQSVSLFLLPFLWRLPSLLEDEMNKRRRMNCSYKYQAYYHRQ